MKRIKFYFLLSCLIFSIIACSRGSEASETPDTPSISPDNPYASFGVPESIHVIKSSNYKINGISSIEIIGTDKSKNNNAWIGIYELGSKKKIVEFSDNENWPIRGIDGKGSIIDISNEFYFYPIFINKDTFVFHLSTSRNFDINYNSDWNNGSIEYSRFYIVNNGKITNKFEGNTLDKGNLSTVINFRKYFDGFILAKKNNNGLTYDYYNQTADHIFNSNILALNPVSFEEELLFDNTAMTAKKINLKTNTILFEKKIAVEGVVYGNKADSVKEVNGNVWTITNKWKEYVKVSWGTLEYVYINKYTIDVTTGDTQVIIKKQEVKQ
ncbi:hypothetical protein [Elizabethkingia occulta]|uniref:hypothetical protein n=1 Tax=Elizabethkingia occulta TaxID=1867263 RepID=UPI00398C534A